MDSLGAWPLEEVAPLVRAAHDRKRPVVFVGTGTERLYRPESREIVSAVLTPRVAFWTVRSERDRERLTALGVDGERVEVAADLAWLLSPQSSDFGSRTLAGLGVATGPIVGVNLNGEAIMLQKQPRLFEQLASFLDSVVEAQSVHVLFFCSEVREGPTFDKSAAQKTMALMRHSGRATLVPNRYWTPQELLSIVACCRLVVSTRYHPCLFAALQGVPFVAIQRSDKVSDLCSDLEWPFGIPLENVEAPAMLECVAQIERRRDHLSERLQLAHARQAEKSRRNKLAIDALTTAARSLTC
jgi:polysaccharide pyruvyl transferase WcaK-like protein